MKRFARVFCNHFIQEINNYESQQWYHKKNRHNRGNE